MTAGSAEYYGDLNMIFDRVLLNESFLDFPVGVFPYDYTPLGEYHYYPPKGYRGAWYEPTNRGWRLGGHWLVLEDGGQHFMEQTTNTGYLSLLVAGETTWTDYLLTVRLRPLLAEGLAGILFRYQTGRSYYAFYFAGNNKVQLVRRDGADTIVLAEENFVYNCDNIYEIGVELTGPKIQCLIDGVLIIQVEDSVYLRGKVGLAAMVPAQYHSVVVAATSSQELGWQTKIMQARQDLAAVQAGYPQPLLWRKINLRGFGAGRHIRFGDLTGNGQLDFVIAQNIKHNGIDLYSMIRCLTAFDLEGRMLWQYGEPGSSEDAYLTTSDLPFQIYDIDGDGSNEVILLRNFKLIILDGGTGREKRSMPTPVMPKLTDKTCFKWPESDFNRINGDAVIIANFSGNKRPTDILIKNRYNFLWAYDNNLNLLWHAKCNTGHFPQPHDFNGDGRDELVAGWSMFDADGKLQWDLGLSDHVDEIAIGRFNPQLPYEQIALVAGDEGFLIVSPDGRLLRQEKIGHAQRLTAAKFRPDLPGLQFYVVTYWDNAGIVSLHDCEGKVLDMFEPPATGNILNPVNWTGAPVELALLSASHKHGGLIDGHGRIVVALPADGHPELACEAINLTGDSRDELVVWDAHWMYIYTQDQPCRISEPYRPRRYPHYNNSNYRAEISVP